MTYETQEISTEGGQPVELYLFSIAGTRYAYTNAEEDIVEDGITYRSETIQRSNIENNMDAEDQQLTINVPWSNQFANLFIGVIPGTRVTLTIRQFHRTDGTTELVIVWSGFVSTVSFKQDARLADISCRPLIAFAQRRLPRFRFQNLCNNMLYDTRCTILEATFRETVSILSVNGRMVTVSGASNVGAGADYWEAGFIRFGDEYRLIVGQDEDVMLLNLEFRISPVGSTVFMNPGCKGTASVCNTKFSNILNFGGFSFVPKKNPFEGMD